MKNKINLILKKMTLNQILKNKVILNNKLKNEYKFIIL